MLSVMIGQSTLDLRIAHSDRPLTAPLLSECIYGALYVPDEAQLSVFVSFKFHCGNSYLSCSITVNRLTSCTYIYQIVYIFLFDISLYKLAASLKFFCTIQNNTAAVLHILKYCTVIITAL